MKTAGRLAGIIAAALFGAAAGLGTRDLGLFAADASGRSAGLDPRTAEMVAELPGSGARIWLAVFSPDGRTLATAGREPQVRLWSAATRREIRTFEPGAHVYQLGFSGDGKYLLATSMTTRSLRVFDVSDGSEKCSIPGVSGYVHRIAASPDGKHVAVCGGGPCRIYELPGGAEVRSFAPGTPILASAYSKDGKRIATLGQQGSVKIWDAASGAELASLSGAGTQTYGIAFSPNGRHLVTADRTGPARIWDAGTGTEVSSLAGPAGLNAISWSPDGRWIAGTAVDGSARFWDASTRKEVRSLDAHKGAAWSAAFSPDGRLFVTTGDDGKIRIWGARSGAARPEEK